MDRKIMIDLEVDAAVLIGVIKYLEEKTDLPSWPEELRAALALALDDATVAAAEAEKSLQLKRHSFGDLPSPFVGERVNVPQRWSERIRADLPGIVDFGSGFHLIDSKALAHQWLTTEH